MPAVTEAKRSLLPYSRVYLDDTEDPVVREAALEFRLLYEGELFASANGSSHVKHKHAIRREFHLQLRRQWERHSGLRQHAAHLGNTGDPEANEQERFEAGLSAIGRNWSRAGFEFVPLVTKAFPVHCAIDITLLRPGDDKYLSCQGDIDGQLKTLFDALRIPDDVRETGGAVPAPDEMPFFCLLADDKLISSLKVEADELLMLPHQRQIKGSDAFAVIRVNATAKLVGGMGNYW